MIPTHRGGSGAVPFAARGLLAAAAALLATGLAAQPAIDEPAPVADRPATVTGSLGTYRGLPVLHLRGTHHERGFTEGYLMGDVLRKLIAGYALKRIPGQTWNKLVLPAVRARVVAPEWVRERAKGQIDGMRAGGEPGAFVAELDRDLTVDDMVALATLPDFFGLMCSSIAAWGPSAAGGGPIVGRNLDYPASAELLEHSMLVVHAPLPGRRGWVSLGWPGFLGLITGVSDAGVSLAIHDVHEKARWGAEITPRVTALQELLERFDPTGAHAGDPAAGAAAILGGFAYGMGGNGMLAWRDSEGGPGAVVIEFGPERRDVEPVVVRAPAPGDTILSCTNHHRERTADTGRWRYAKLWAGLTGLGDGALDVGGAWELLGQARVGGTLHAVVTDLAAMRMRIALRRAPRRDEWFTLEDIDLAALLREARDGAPAAPAGSSGGR